MTRLVVEIVTLLPMCVPCDFVCCLYPGYGNADWLLLWTVFGELTVGAVSCHRDLESMVCYFALGIQMVVVSNIDSHQE